MRLLAIIAGILIGSFALFCVLVCLACCKISSIMSKIEDKCWKAHIDAEAKKRKEIHNAL